MFAEIKEEKKAMLVEIEAGKEAVEEGLAALEAEKEAMKSHDTSDTDIIKVNVSGNNIDVLRSTLVQRSTLCVLEGSLLASQFSGRWEDTTARGYHFSVVINKH